MKRVERMCVGLAFTCVSWNSTEFYSFNRTLLRGNSNNVLNNVIYAFIVSEILSAQ